MKKIKFDPNTLEITGPVVVTNKNGCWIDPETGVANDRSCWADYVPPVIPDTHKAGDYKWVEQGKTATRDVVKLSDAEIAAIFTELQEAKRSEILTAYAKADAAPVTVAMTPTVSYIWPGGYDFVKKVRDRRDFAAEFGGPSATVTLRTAAGPQINLTQAEASSLILELGMVAVGNADKRDYLLDQINNAATAAELDKIKW